MRTEQEIIRVHDLLAAKLQHENREDAEFDSDFRMIFVASLDALAWALERPEGEIFGSLVGVGARLSLDHED